MFFVYVRVYMCILVCVLRTCGEREVCACVCVCCCVFSCCFLHRHSSFFLFQSPIYIFFCSYFWSMSIRMHVCTKMLLLLLLFWSRLRVMACSHSQGEAPFLFLFCFLYIFSSIAYLHSAYMFCLPAAPWYKRHIPLSIFFIVLPILFYTQFFEKQTKL